MERHIIVHTDEKPFTCPDPTCSKTFKRAEAFKSHLQSHSKHFNFVCPMTGCTAKFRKKTILQYHLAKHHPAHNFTCSGFGCQQTFKNLQQLKNHQKFDCNNTKEKTVSEITGQASTAEELEASIFEFENEFWKPEEPQKHFHTEKGESYLSYSDESPLMNFESFLPEVQLEKQEPKKNVESLLQSMLVHLKQENQELKEKLADILAQCEKEDLSLS